MQMRALPKPISASTNGPAAGATLGVALACDLRIASDEAQFMVGFIDVGLILEAGVLFFMPRLNGLGRAADYAYTNQPITAGKALEWGLVNRLAPADQIRQQVGEWTRAISRVPVGAMDLANLPGKASHGVLLTNHWTTIEQGHRPYSSSCQGQLIIWQFRPGSAGLQTLLEQAYVAAAGCLVGRDQNFTPAAIMPNPQRDMPIT